MLRNRGIRTRAGEVVIWNTMEAVAVSHPDGCGLVEAKCEVEGIGLAGLQAGHVRHAGAIQEIRKFDTLALRGQGYLSFGPEGSGAANHYALKQWTIFATDLDLPD